MAAVRHTSPDTGSLRKYDYAHPGYQRELAAFLLGLGLGGQCNVLQAGEDDPQLLLLAQDLLAAEKILLLQPVAAREAWNALAKAESWFTRRREFYRA